MSARVYTAGDRLDRFEVISVLGCGGSATVYRVRHILLGSEYALKLVAAPSGEDRERLLREGRAQSMLRHPNIVPVLDAVSIGEDLGLVLELVDGPDLARWLEGNLPDLATIDRLAADLFDGLARAHASGFIHRDLKPSNVLLADPDGDVTARIVDFGLAKDFSDVSPGLTQSTWIFGTPAYAAPEQAAGARTVDVRADVFSLGALLYEISTGQRAFPGKNILDVLQCAAADRYIDPRELRAELPARMADAIRAALRADPDARAPDVAALRAIWSGGEAHAVAEAPPAVRPARVEPASAPLPPSVPLPPRPERPWLSWGVPVLAALAGLIAVMLVGLRAGWPVAPGTAAMPSDAHGERAGSDTPTPGSTPDGPETAPTTPASPTAVAPADPSTGAPSGVDVRRPRHASPSVAPGRTDAVAPILPAATEPTPAAPPAAPLPRPEVRVDGDVSEVVLFTSDGERVPAGQVDVGAYVVEARFHADEPRVAALRLDVQLGDVVAVTCHAGVRRCALRKLTVDGSR